MRSPARRSSRFHARLAAAWDATVRETCPEIVATPPFQPVVVAPADDESTRRVVDGRVDWWDLASLVDRQRAFQGRVLWSADALPYRPDPGSAHTARLLWDLRSRPELLPAVWLAAFLLQAQSDRSATPVWDAPHPRRLLEDILELCVEVLLDAGVPLWHHKATDTLRGARAVATQLRRLGIVPTSPDAAVTTAQLCIRLALADHTLVRLIVSSRAEGLCLIPSA